VIQTHIAIIGTDSRYDHLEGLLSERCFLSLFPADQTAPVVLQILNIKDPTPDLILIVINSATSLEQGTFAIREFKTGLRTAHVPIVILLAGDLLDLSIALYRSGVNTVIDESKLLDSSGKVDREVITHLWRYWTDLAVLPKAS
jgi:hypothetical protein